ncbi:ABC transporter permease [Planctomycetota bacterium]
MRLLRRLLAGNLVPLLFLVVSVAGIYAADLRVSRISTDVLERFFRNLFIVLSLIVPIVAGLGLNFGIVLGAMAGQIGLIVVQNGRVEGIFGITVAVACSIPIALVLGYLTGLLFNRTRGREMITGIILGFFANGIYQFLFLILAGPVFPLHSKDVLLPQGMGLRVTMNLTTVERGLDDLLTVRIKTESAPPPDAPPDARPRNVYWGEIPFVTLAINVLLCFLIVWFLKTKLGQDLRAVGQSPHVAEVAGINVNRCRIIATCVSIVLAGVGQIIFLQNMAVMNTFQSHEQVGFYAIAALLVGGATVSRVTIWNAVVGTLLFHTLIVVVSLAGQQLMDSPQIGEYLREFFAYAIIGATIAIHAWRTKA